MLKLSQEDKEYIFGGLKGIRYRKLFRLIYILELPKDHIINQFNSTEEELKNFERDIKAILGNNKIAVKCKDCGCKFYAKTKHKAFCEDCIKRHRKESLKEESKKHIKPENEAAPASPKRKKKAKSLNQILSDLERYNKKHKTILSYGEYVSLLNIR